MKRLFLFLSLIILIGGFTGCSEKTQRVRIGYFPNITHAQALVGKTQGILEKKLGPDISVEWNIFNAGPSVIEAMFANHLDIAYVGPSPAVNGFIKSQGEALRLIAGSASGGATLVVLEGSEIQTSKDFQGKKIASPQFGNTQDVALRSWLEEQGLKLKEKGGNVSVLPLANADQLNLFIKGELDASWCVEPWTSIFIKKAKAKIFLDEASLWPGGVYATTVVIVRKSFLDQHPQQVQQFLEAHKEVTQWIVSHPEEAKQIFNQEFEKIMHKKIEADILDSAWSRVRFTTDPMRSSIEAQAYKAYQLGFLKKKPNLEDFFLKN